MKDIKHLLGERIRSLRKERGLSQEELGSRAELHFTHIGAVERGETNCSIDTLEKISQGLNITINDLFLLPTKPQDLEQLKTLIIKEIGKCSPEIIKIVAGIIKEFKSSEMTTGKKRRTKSI